MPEKPFAVIAWVQRGDEFLAVSRKHNHEDLGFAGGKIEEGEEPEAAALRELEEETGLKAKKGRFLYCAESTTKTFFTWVYVVEEWEGEAHSREGSWVGWVPVSRFVDKRNSFSPYYERMFNALGVTYR